ncbi:MAG: glycosyltransferase family protein [Bacteroidales bacterium]
MVLVCPLDWGIGHATRCVPVIRELAASGASVIIAADGRPYDFLKSQFPALPLIRFPGFRIIYPNGKNMALRMLLQSPGILYGIWKEHRKLKELTAEYQIDLVISDNRFGLWSKKVKSVYITHQLMIKAAPGLKWIEPLLYRIHQWFINRYDACWVPDVPGKLNLSGDLSHRYPLPSHGSYIGTLSRFAGVSPSNLSRTNKPPNKLLVLISGPEPQRTIFEKLILKELEKLNPGTTVVLQGLPGKEGRTSPFPGVTIFPHLPDQDIRDLIIGSEIIICRPGYSTVMDLVRLGRTAVLVPTPGQTEQEYLARHLSGSGLFTCMAQDSFKLVEAISAMKKIPATDNITTFNIINTFGQNFKQLIDFT